MIPQKCPVRGRSAFPSKHVFLSRTRVHNPNGISIGSAVFAGLITASNTQERRPVPAANILCYTCDGAWWFYAGPRLRLITCACYYAQVSAGRQRRGVLLLVIARHVHSGVHTLPVRPESLWLLCRSNGEFRLPPWQYGAPALVVLKVRGYCRLSGSGSCHIDTQRTWLQYDLHT